MANIKNCFMKLSVDFTTVSGWLERRMVRRSLQHGYVRDSIRPTHSNTLLCEAAWSYEVAAKNKVCSQESPRKESTDTVSLQPTGS